MKRTGFNRTNRAGDVKSLSHSRLTAMVMKWLRRTHAVVVSELSSGETPDVIGWNNRGVSTLVEVKISRADFLRDAGKYFRREASMGMGYKRFYASPSGMLGVSDLPEGWGLLEPTPRGAVRVAVLGRAFYERAAHHELSLLTQACARATEGWGRRVFGDIAPAAEDGDPGPTMSKILRDLREDNRKLRLEMQDLHSKLAELQAPQSALEGT